MRHFKSAIWIFFFFKGISLCGAGFVSLQDTLKNNQELYNGSLWTDYFSIVRGDQFLFDGSFLPGEVTIKGKSYRTNLRYDIFEDELQTPAGRFGILQINKEIVDSFSLVFNRHKYCFVPLRNQSQERTRSYYQTISHGGVSLYVRHQKKIDKHADIDGNTKFYQTSKLYLVKDSTFHPVRSRRAIIKLLDDDKIDINSYIKKQRLKLRIRHPETFEPLIRIYNSLTTGK